MPQRKCRVGFVIPPGHLLRPVACKAACSAPCKVDYHKLSPDLIVTCEEGFVKEMRKKSGKKKFKFTIDFATGIEYNK
jgi:hypothetical protein